jgi:hypothetical protein
MSLTPFAPVFILLLLIACAGLRGWVIATGIAVYFQAAAPFMIDAGGRFSGLMPSYGLLCIGLLHAVLYQLRISRRSGRGPDPATSATGWLIVFTVISVAGAVLLPRIFEGQADVLPPAYGMDTLFVERVHPSGRNSIQAFYLLCNLALFLLCRWVIRARLVSLQEAVRGLALGAACSALLGLYQVVGYQLGWPWPHELINSNSGVGQLYNQHAFGLQRMSSTFLEPSLLGFHFLSAFALLGLGLRRRWIGALLLICLLISTSSSGYAGLLLLLPLALWIYRAQLDQRAVLGILLLLLLLGGAYLLDLLWLDGQVTNTFLTGKLSSTSGIDRARTNAVAWHTLIDSWGLGVGVGSSRVSGLPMTLASTTGIPGLLCFIAFLTTLIRACLRRGDADGRAFALAILAIAIVWTISIPDLALPYAWVLCGFAAGLLTLPARAPTVASLALPETTALPALS